MSTRNEKEEQFDWWITCIPDKILALKKQLPKAVSDKLDFTLTSLDTLEKYLLEEYTFESIQIDKGFWDGCASYLGYVYKLNIPDSEWYIELEDEKDVFYNKPSLRIKNKANFVPHAYITTAIDRGSGNFISTIINNHIRYSS